jgi:hypothetical protein
MSRVPTRRTSGEELPAKAVNADESGMSPATLSLGWRVAIAVWVVGFAALVLYELGDFLVKVVKGMY